MKDYQYYSQESLKEELGNRLIFAQQIEHRGKPQMIRRLRQAAKEIKDTVPNKAYRIRRIYIPIIKLGGIPNTQEFPKLMWKAKLSVNVMIKELNVFCRAFN